MAKFHARPSRHYRYEHYDPLMDCLWPSTGSVDSNSSNEDDSPDK
jgi:hypothetical protein